MAKRVDLNGGGPTPHRNDPRRLNHLCDGLIKVRKHVSRKNHNPVDASPTPSLEPDPIIIDPIDPGAAGPPHFIDRTLFVTNIGQNNKSVKIESFTEREDGPVIDYDYLTGLTNFTSTGLTFIQLSQNTEDAHNADYLTGLTNFTSTDLSFLRFSTNNENVKDKNYLSGLTNMTAEGITIMQYQPKQSVEIPSGPPSLQIKSFGGTAATVVNAI